MSLKEIENRIIKEAELEAAKIKQEADASLKNLEIVHAEKLKEIKIEFDQSLKRKTEEIKRSLLVPCRLKAKNAVLEEKQTILTQLYEDLQKEHRLSRADLDKIREETEIKISSLLFGED